MSVIPAYIEKFYQAVLRQLALSTSNRASRAVTPAVVGNETVAQAQQTHIPQQQYSEAFDATNIFEGLDFDLNDNNFTFDPTCEKRFCVSFSCS